MIQTENNENKSFIEEGNNHSTMNREYIIIIVIGDNY